MIAPHMNEQFTPLLATLVGFRSVDGEPEEKQKIAAFTAQWLEQNKVDVDFHPHAESPSLIANIPGEGDPILLLTHLDVVPAPAGMFEMNIEGDRAFGRGVIDDKASVAMVMLLLAELMKWEKRPAIRAVFASDEEIGSRDGVLRLLEMGVLTPARAVIALDGGSDDTVITQEKGVFHFTLHASGISVHNSMPWEGDNAIEKVMRVYQRIKQALEPAHSSDSKHWHETVSIGAVEGGMFVNQVPASAHAKIDIRFTEKYSVQDIEHIINAQLEDGVTMQLIGNGECFQTNPEHPLCNIYFDAMHSKGLHMKTDCCHGATDARFFAHVGAPIWMHDPTGGGLHTDNEWLDIPSAYIVYNGLEEFCRRVSGL